MSGFQLGRYGLREVMYSQIYDYNSSTPLLYLEFPNNTQLEVSGETVYATGGRGGPNIISFTGNRNGTFTIDTQIFTMSTIAILTGGQVLNEETDIYRVQNATVKNVAGDMVVSLEKTPDGSMMPTVFQYENGIQTIQVPVVEINDKELVLDPESVSEGDEVRVFYQFKVSNDSYTLNIDANTFPPYVRLVNEGFFTDAASGLVVDGQMLLYKAKAQPTFTLTGANTGDPTTINMVFDLFNDPQPDGREAMINLTIYKD